MSPEVLTLILFSLLILVLLSGIPLVFGFGFVGVVMALWQLGPDIFYLIPLTAFATWTNFILICIPLFILMANILERSGLAEDLYKTMYMWMGGLRGGLAMGTIVICAIFAAMAGISGVATVTMGLISIPAMISRGYDKRLAVGSVSAGGTLGILIPPSIIMILYASFTEVSVGKLFMGGVFPGIVIAILFILYIGIRCALNPKMGPSVPMEERVGWREKMVSLRGVILPVMLIIVVLGVIYFGICTPTEASGIGAIGAFICMLIYRRFSWQTLKEVLTRTFSLTVMVMWIVLGAKVYSHVYHAIGAPEVILSIMSGLELNRWVIILIMQFILLILGMFVDPMGILMITMPIFIPIVEVLGFSTLWFGILFTINMEAGYITPPFGFNLFYMKGIASKWVSMTEVYKSIIPFVILLVIGILIVMLFPELALWLPSTM